MVLEQLAKPRDCTADGTVFHPRAIPNVTGGAQIVEGDPMTRATADSIQEGEQLFVPSGKAILFATTADRKGLVIQFGKNVTSVHCLFQNGGLRRRLQGFGSG